MGGGGEGSRHADQGIGAGRSGDVGEDHPQAKIEDCAEHGAHEQRGSKNAARSARTEGQVGGDQFEDQQGEGGAEGQLAGEGAFDHIVADIVDLWHDIPGDAGQFGIDQGDDPQQDAAEHRLDPFGDGFPFGKQILRPVQRAHKEYAPQSCEDCQQRVEGILPQAVDAVFYRDEKGGGVAEEGMPDDAGGHRGDHHVGEVAHAELAKDHLKGEDNSGNGGVEGGGDTAGRAAGHQNAHPFFREVQALADGGADCAADLHDRTFTPDRAAAAD